MMKEERKKAREERYFKTPVFERFEVGLFLSLIGGFLDAYTFVARGGVFACSPSICAREISFPRSNT